MNEKVSFINNTQQNIKNIRDSIENKEVLLIPKNNLLSNLDNEEIYYSKIADELIRYNKIKQFMFEPKIVLSFNELKYNLHDNEIILLQSLLTNEYFENLIEDVRNKYVTFNSFNTVEPNITQKYDNTFETTVSINNTLTSNDNDENRNETKIKKSIITKKNTCKLHNKCDVVKKFMYTKLKLQFKGYKELEFSDKSVDCTFDILITLIKNKGVEEINIDNIKKILLNKYLELSKNNNKNLKNMLHYYGYPEAINFEKGNTQIEDIIMNKNYYVNNFDILIITNKYNIPVTLYNSKSVIGNNSDYISLNIDNTEKESYIIRVPNFYKYKPNMPKYKLFVDKHDNCLLNIDNLPEENIRKKILSQDNDIENLFQLFENITIDDDNELSEGNELLDNETREKKKIKGKKIKLNIL